MNKLLLLRIFAAFVCLYCLSLGALLNGPVAGVEWALANLLNYEMPADSPLPFAARLVGAYMAFFGASMGLVAWQPQRHRALLSLAAGFLILRLVQRLLTFDSLNQLFGLEQGDNLTYLLTLAAMAGLCLYFRIELQRQPASA